MGYVYFLEAIGQNVFKIGKAEVLPRRFNELDTASPCELRIWAVIKNESYAEIEKKIHNFFNSRRLKKNNGRTKEWFIISKDELIDVINKFGGFYTAEIKEKSSLKQHLIWDNIIGAFDKLFPMKDHGIVFMVLSFIILCGFQISIPLILPALHPELAAIAISCLFFWIAVSAGNRKIWRFILIIVGYWTEQLIFADANYEIAELMGNSLLIASLSVTIFIFTPILFCRFLILISGKLDHIKLS